MISIVTISFNQAPFLEECLQSVIGQRRPGEVEYVVIDPGSTDGSRELIERHRAGIDHVLLERDNGPADGLNKGFARSRGDIFGYLNSDDRLAPGALAYVDAFFRRHSDVDVVCGTVRILDREGRPTLRKRTADPFDLRRYAAGICTVCQQGTFFRRRAFEAAGGFNANNRISWDGELLVDMAIAGMKFATVSRVLGDFRVYPEALSSARRDLQNAEHVRLSEKIRAHGVALYSPAMTRVQRLLYKLNAGRHLRYVLAG